jgi:uridine phosphorylase
MLKKLFSNPIVRNKTASLLTYKNIIRKQQCAGITTSTMFRTMDNRREVVNNAINYNSNNNTLQRMQVHTNTDGCVQLKNDNLKKLDSDFLYHLGFSSSQDLQEIFGDVKFFCCGGAASRMEIFANQVANELSDEFDEYKKPYGFKPMMIGDDKRYAIFKVGPVLISSHGMGMPSMSILLHEVTKMLHYANAKDVTYFRLGSSGGIGVEPGTVVLTTQGLNGMMEPHYSLPILGKMVHRPALINEALVNNIKSAAEKRLPHLSVTPGKTMAADCFYEGQGRLDGAICDYEEKDKMEFVRKLDNLGVRNIEMEAVMFAAFTNHLNIKAAVACVTLLNRLEGDQVLTPLEDLHAFDEYPGHVVLSYIKEELSKM